MKGFGAVVRPNRPPAGARFQLFLIKPSHYDDDGYVIQWVRSTMPSNSLAVLYGLAMDAEARAVLGADVGIDIHAIDETNKVVDTRRIVRVMKKAGGFGLVGLIGVQSNQYPRALEIARPLRAAGLPVVMGGFHVSGVLAMFDDTMIELREALDMGVSLFAGEAEGRLDEVLRDAAAGTLKPIYNYLAALPAMQGSPTPYLPLKYAARTLDKHTSFDAGRGCPFQCSFCTIINVQGRKSRHRSPDDVEAILRGNLAQGVKRFFITDDNFARNKDWEAIFDRIIQLREGEGLDVRFTIQVDTLVHKIPGFVDKAKRAGVTRCFIGLENVNPDNLLAAKKKQNRLHEYRAMLLQWKRAGIITYAGYIIGFPNDTPASIERDIALIKRELPVDVLEFFVLTPLPGSEDHKVLWTKGVAMDPDMNRYDAEHVVTDHPLMTRREWEEIYWRAWALYYTPEHIETILRRGHACDVGISRLSSMILWFSSLTRIERVHPLQSGVIRIKRRRDRRPGFAREAVIPFYLRYGLETVAKLIAFGRDAWWIDRLRHRIKKDPACRSYTDLALQDGDDDADITPEFARQPARRVPALANAGRPTSVNA